MIYLSPLATRRSPFPRDAEFSPLNIGGIHSWFDPTQQIFYSGAIPAHNGLVSDWKNLNNLAQVATQADTGLSPSYVNSGINSASSLKFVPNDYLELSLTNPITSSSLTAFVVCKRAFSVLGSSTLVFRNSAQSNDYDNTAGFVLGDEFTASNVRTYRNGTLGQVTHPGNGVPIILTTKFNGTNNTLYVNGAGTTPVASTGAFNINRILIASRYYGGLYRDGYNGNIGDIIIYNAALSDADLLLVHQYLATKYSISI